MTSTMKLCASARASATATAALTLTLCAALGACSSDNSATGSPPPGTDASTAKPDGAAGNETGAPPGEAGSDATAPSAEAGGEAGPVTADAGEGGVDGNAGPGAVAQKVVTTLLFADTPDAGARGVDPNLLNAWGLAFSGTGIAWISDNGSGLATLYTTASSTPLGLVVTVPLPGDAGGPSNPTGQIFNASTNFMGDKFIIATENGTVAGWQSGTTAVTRVDRSGSGAVYKGLAIAPSTPPVLVAANFNAGAIDVFDATYAATTPAAGAWSDPSVPAGYAPFNVQTIGTQVFVAYAMQDANKHDDVRAAGHGAVSVFDATGTLVKSLIGVGTTLDSPWGLAQAPTGWGSLGGALLVGNFGNGLVNAYNPATGTLLGNLVDGSGAPISIPGLWALAFGNVNNPDAGISTNQLYFTAGPNGEADGLYGFWVAQ